MSEVKVHHYQYDVVIVGAGGAEVAIDEHGALVELQHPGEGVVPGQRQRANTGLHQRVAPVGPVGYPTREHNQ